VHRDALYYAEPGAGWGTRGKPRVGDAITPKAQAWIAEFSQARLTERPPGLAEGT